MYCKALVDIQCLKCKCSYVSSSQCQSGLKFGQLRLFSDKESQQFIWRPSGANRKSSIFTFTTYKQTVNNNNNYNMWII